MLKVSHVNVGASVALGSIILTGGYISPVILFYPFFAVLQDADHPNSAISRMLPFFRIPGGHRGFSHTVWFAWIAAALCYFTIKYFYPQITRTDGLILFILCHSHLMADFFTIRMLPLFYPFIKRSFGIPIVNTGGIMEKTFTLSVTALNVFLSYYIVMKYWVTDKIVYASYDKQVVYLAMFVGALAFWGLFRQEIADIRRYPAQIVKRLLKTAVFFAINLGIVFFATSYANANFLPEIATFLKSISVGISPSTAVSILFGLAMIPSIIKISDSIDKTSFLFATVFNTVFMLSLVILFISNAGDITNVVNGVVSSVK